MRKCYIKQFADGEYGWDGLAACSCVMSVALKREVHYNDLEDLVSTSKITKEERIAINKVDGAFASDADVEVIKKLAARYSVMIVKRRN